ncbi:MAG: fibronectin type III domain-containing protein [Elusimicrobia bacterium]|nr:fibronectin type III domain-containing protein [Elusimicrobiota bacterium]
MKKNMGRAIKERRSGEVAEWRSVHALILSASLPLCLFLTLPIYGAGPKSSGNIVITDDLQGGSAAGKSTSGAIEVTGGLGQLSDSLISGGAYAAESGFYSKIVSTPSTFGFQSISTDAATINWTDASPANPTAARYIIDMSSTNFTLGEIFTNNGFASPVTVKNLTPNTTYWAHIQAAYLGSDNSPYTDLITTATLATLPSATNYFFVSESSITIKWGLNGNNPLTEYRAKLSTAPTFDGLDDKLGSWGIFTSTGFRALSANATYYTQVKARNYAVPPVETGWVTLGSTITKIVPPASMVTTFTAVNISSLTAQWDANGNGEGTVFEAQITSTNFSNVIFTSATVLTNAGFDSLVPNVTYYLQVRATNPGVGSFSNYLNLGSTVTPAAIPLTMVSTYTAVAADSLAFQWNTNGNSNETLFIADISSVVGFASNIISSQTLLNNASYTSLIPNTTYFTRVKARNHAGTDTDPLVMASTVTLANPPLTMASTYTAVAVSSLTFQWMERQFQSAKHCLHRGDFQRYRPCLKYHLKPDGFDQCGLYQFNP